MKLPYPSLDEVWSKLGRAREHLEALKRETAGHPKTIGVVPEFQPGPNNTGVFVIKIAALPNISRFSLIIGDAIQNYRSTLDYLTWQLAWWHRGTRRPFARTQFAIADSHDPGFIDAFWMLRDLHPVHQEMIERCQPYHEDTGLRRYKDDSLIHLAWLRDLSNMDKHRELHITRFASEGGNTRIVSYGGFDRGTPYYLIAVPLELGAEVVRVEVTGVKPGAYVNVEYDPAPYVTFDNGARVERSLGAIDATVTRIVRLFRPFFRPERIPWVTPVALKQVPQRGRIGPRRRTPR